MIRFWNGVAFGLIFYLWLIIYMECRCFGFRQKVFTTNVNRIYWLMPFGILWRLHSMTFSFDFQQTLWIHTRKNFEGQSWSFFFMGFRSNEEIPFAKWMLQIHKCINMKCTCCSICGQTFETKFICISSQFKDNLLINMRCIWKSQFKMGSQVTVLTFDVMFLWKLTEKGIERKRRSKKWKRKRMRKRRSKVEFERVKGKKRKRRTLESVC